MSGFTEELEKIFQGGPWSVQDLRWDIRHPSLGEYPRNLITYHLKINRVQILDKDHPPSDIEKIELEAVTHPVVGPTLKFSRPKMIIGYREISEETHRAGRCIHGRSLEMACLNCGNPPWALRPKTPKAAADAATREVKLINPRITDEMMEAGLGVFSAEAEFAGARIDEEDIAAIYRAMAALDPSRDFHEPTERARPPEPAPELVPPPEHYEVRFHYLNLINPSADPLPLLIGCWATSAESADAERCWWIDGSSGPVTPAEMARRGYKYGSPLIRPATRRWP